MRIPKALVDPARLAAALSPLTMRHTKIVATLGPAQQQSGHILDALIAAGVDVFRFNFSHGTHDSHGHDLPRVRDAAARAGRHVAILQDLSGPKIRTGRLPAASPSSCTKATSCASAPATGRAAPDASSRRTPT